MFVTSKFKLIFPVFIGHLCFFYFFKIPYSYCLLTFIFGHQLHHMVYGVFDFNIIKNVK